MVAIRCIWGFHFQVHRGVVTIPPPLVRRVTKKLGKTMINSPNQTESARSFEHNVRNGFCSVGQSRGQS